MMVNTGTLAKYIVIAAAALLECVPTSTAVNPSLSLPIQVTAALMSSSTLWTMTRHVNCPCWTVLTVVVRLVEGQVRSVTHLVVLLECGGPDLNPKGSSHRIALQRRVLQQGRLLELVIVVRSRDQ
eukprot:10327734-Ditylum_brightwellii.AAC.1